MRVAGTRNAIARAFADIPSGFRNSSSSTSPGCVVTRSGVPAAGILEDSVVIDDLDLLGVLAGPTEADAPLVIDADRVLATAIPLQGLQSITGRQPKESQLNRGIDQLQLNQRALPDVTRNAAGAPGEPQLLGIAISETLDHA